MSLICFFVSFPLSSSMKLICIVDLLGNCFPPYFSIVTNNLHALISTCHLSMQNYPLSSKSDFYQVVCLPSHHFLFFPLASKKSFIGQTIILTGTLCFPTQSLSRSFPTCFHHQYTRDSSISSACCRSSVPPTKLCLSAADIFSGIYS